MLRKLPLSEKLVVYFVLLGILIICAIAPFSYYQARKALLDRTFDQLTSVRVMRTQQLESFFSDRLREVGILAQSEAVNEFLVTMQANLRSNDTKTLLPSLAKEILPSTDYVSDLIFINNDGLSICLHRGYSDSLIKTEQFSIPLNFLEIKKSVLLDYISISEGEIHILAIAGVKDIGYVALAVPSSAIDKILVENDPINGLGYSGECYLVGKDSLMRSTSRFQSSSILRTRVQTSTFNAALTNSSGTGITVDYRNIDVLSAYGPLRLPGLNWVMLAEIDLKETMLPVKGLRNSIFAISVLISLIMFAIAFFTARWISRPLRRFGEAVEKMSEGNLDVAVSIKGKDEIGQLAERFNAMAEQLNAQHKELEQQRMRQYELTLDGQELERKRLSRELHDGLGQHLIAMKLKLEQITPENTCDAFKKVKVVKEDFDNTIEEIRRISNDLMPSSLESFGLNNALRKLCLDTESSSGIRIKFQADKLSFSVSDRDSLYLFRIAQEALNNVIKHSQAGLVWLSLSDDTKSITLEIRDNGRGIKNLSEAQGQGQGLYNIEERVKILNGKMEILTMEDEGLLIRIIIPTNDIRD